MQSIDNNTQHTTMDNQYLQLVRMVIDSGYFVEYYVPCARVAAMDAFLQAFKAHRENIRDEPQIVIDGLDALDRDPDVVKVVYNHGCGGSYIVRGPLVWSAKRPDIAEAPLHGDVAFPAGFNVVDRIMSILLH